MTLVVATCSTDYDQVVVYRISLAGGAKASR